MPTDDEFRAIYADTKTIAVVGASGDPDKPAHSIPAYLQEQGFRILPVSPKGGKLFGEQVATSLSEIDEPVDVVDVFRPADETPKIAKEAVAAGAKVLWLQTGISSDEAAEVAREGGLQVVMDTCMGETHRQLFRAPGQSPPSA